MTTHLDAFSIPTSDPSDVFLQALSLWQRVGQNFNPKGIAFYAHVALVSRLPFILPTR
jgi:hypothetical protein